MKRNTKSALLLSVVSIVVCCAMLMGTTMAWFTDSVTSARNQIIAGNLDVELYRDTIADANKIDGNTKLFDEVKLWEPGAVLVENLVVSNEGNLALKYKLALSHFNATETPDGKTLTDVIKVGFVEGGVTKTERADVLAEVTTSNWTSFDLFKLEGKLDPKDKDLTSDVEDTRTVGIVLYWEPTDNDNDYNMNNGENTVLDITFGINLFATQLDAEEDSFGKDYDVIDDLDMITENINGVTYGTTITGDYVMISVDDDALTNFTVDNAVTILGTGDGENDNDRVFGKNAPLTSLILPEGLVEIKDNALNTLPNLTTVNLPSTLKTIGIQAFRITGMSELKVPKSVETVKLGAFRDMANLTTVTVEGNVAFDNFAFRSCPNLTSIYLLGDDVTFTGGQFATHSDNGDATGITIYVKNATVAARVYAAQASAYGYEVKILGTAADGSDAVPVTQVKNATDLETAVANGGNVVVSKNIDMVGATVAVADGVKLMGDGDVTISNALFTVADDQSAAFTDIKFAGATTIEAKGDGRLSFVDCEFNVAPKKYNGFSRAAAIIGANQYYTIDLYLEGCTFNYQYTTGDADLYNAAIFMWSNVNDCVIKDCTFNGYGFVAVKLMNAADGAEIVFEGNTFNMSKQGDANWYHNNAIQIVPQHDKAITTKFINNVFNGDFEDDNIIATIEVMNGGTLSNLTFEQSGNTINGAAVTDANF